MKNTVVSFATVVKKRRGGDFMSKPQKKHPSGKEVADFFAGEAAAEMLIPSLREKVNLIQADGKTAWLGVGIANAFIGSSEKGASSPLLTDVKNIAYTRNPNGEKYSVPFMNGVWYGFSKAFQIQHSRYTFREVLK